MNTNAKRWLSVGVPLTVIALTVSMGMVGASTITYGSSTPAPMMTSFAEATLASVCTFSIDDPIPIGPEPTTAMATFSDRIGDTLTAAFPEDAHVEVLSIKRTRNDTPLTATFVLLAIRATAGQWDVTVRGERGECAGKIWVGQGVRTQKPAVPMPVPATLSPPNASASRFGGSATATKRDCAVFIEDSIVVGRNRVEVLAKYTEPLGNMPAAKFPVLSKVEFISARHDDADEPRSLRLVLNTATAVPGQWLLTLWGDLDTCTGIVYVGAAAKKK